MSRLGINVGIRAVLLLLAMQLTNVTADMNNLEATHRADSRYANFRSGAGTVVDVTNGINTHGPLYLAAGEHDETTYIEAEELIELFSPEPSMTRSIRGIGGVTAGHAEARKQFRNILFDFDSDRIEQSSYPQLREIGKALSVVMAAHPDYRFSIEGHTDSIGDYDYNLQLSHRRAGVVKDYLVVRYGLDSRRITAVGLGEAMSVAPNEIEPGRSLNRRVEIVRE